MFEGVVLTIQTTNDVLTKHAIQEYFKAPLIRHYRNTIWNTLTDDTGILKTATASHFHIVVWTTQQYCFISPTSQTINVDWQAAFSKWRVVQSNSSYGMQVTDGIMQLLYKCLQ